MEPKTDVSKYKAGQIPYIRWTILSLSSIGCWPKNRLGYKSWISNFGKSKLIFMIWFLSCTLMMLYYVTNIQNIVFADQLRIYINFMITFVGMLRMPVTLSKNFCELADTFLKTTHLVYFKNKSKYAEKVFNDVDKISRFITIFIHCEIYCGVLCFNLTAIFNNYRHGMFSSIRPENGTFEHVIYYLLPFDYLTKFRGYWLVVIINWYLTMTITISYYILDVYILILMLNVWGHVKILKNNLLTFPRPEINLTSPSNKSPPWYTVEESAKVTVLLLESLEHYRLIQNFMNNISQTFESMIFLYLCYQQVTGCILLLQCSKLDIESLGMFGIFTLSAFQELIQLCITFEIVNSQIETISDSVYFLPWECMDVKNRKIVLLYLLIAQQPMQLNALGLVPVGVRTMASILKTSLSYFMLLRTTDTNK